MGKMRQRMSHKAIEVIPSTALQGETLIGDEKKTQDGRGILLGIKMSTLATTPTFTPKIQVKGAAGVWVDYWTAAAAISTASDNLYVIYPETTLGGDAIEHVNLPCPFSWRLVLTFGGSGSATVEASAQVLT